MACIEGDSARAWLQPEAKITDDALMERLSEVLQEAEWESGQIDGIVCVTGPGGFTSLRMGVALANVLADQCGAMLAGVHLADVYRARCTEESYIWVHSSKKTQVFVRGEGVLADRWQNAVVTDLDTLLSTWPSGALMAGELLPEHVTLLQERGTAFARLRPVRDALPRIVQDAKPVELPLEPWYGRSW